MNKRLFIVIGFLLVNILLVGCTRTKTTAENIGNVDVVLSTSLPTVEPKSAPTNTVEATPSLAPIPTTSTEQLKQNEFNLLCEQYSQMLIRAEELGRIEDFIYCVDSMTNIKRKQIESEEWKNQINTKPTFSLSEEEISKIKKGQFVKIPPEGAYIDFDLNGVNETFIFCYDPDLTKQQEYIVSINGKEEYEIATGLEGELYVCSIKSDNGEQVYLAIVENGPHQDNRGTYFWTYWDNNPFYLGYIPEPPEGITIEVYDGMNVISYKRYEYESDSWVPYDAHSYISYETSEDNSKKPILEEFPN